jgi:hypothetical protein
MDTKSFVFKQRDGKLLMYWNSPIFTGNIEYFAPYRRARRNEDE